LVSPAGDSTKLLKYEDSHAFSAWLRRSIFDCALRESVYIRDKSTPRTKIRCDSTENLAAAIKRGLKMLIHVIRFLRSWRLCSDILRELSRKSDSELSQMGISRADIPRIAWERTTA
jgi:uncharacterized protein YjiS (DUF1127 family)